MAGKGRKKKKKLEMLCSRLGVNGAVSVEPNRPAERRGKREKENKTETYRER